MRNLSITLFALVIIVNTPHLLAFSKGSFTHSNVVSLRPILVLGDSLAYGEGSTIVNGFGELHRCLKKKLSKKIINLGQIGDTSTDVLNRLDKVLAYNASIIFLSVGGNDVISDIFDKNFPASLTFSNMKSIFKKLVSNQIRVVHIGLEPGDPTTKRLPMIQPIAEKEGVLFVPRAMKGFWGDEEKLPDGLHPTDEGYGIICSRLVKAMEAKRN